MSNQQPAGVKEFFISFETKEVQKSGYVRGTKITIEEDIVGMDENVRIDLADHPLYKKLQAYVLANPR